jgi:hypothetical protein
MVESDYLFAITHYQPNQAYRMKLAELDIHRLIPVAIILLGNS